MGTAFEHPIFDEPTSADPMGPPRKFKFAPTFFIDIASSIFCLLAIGPSFFSVVRHGGQAGFVASAIMLLIFCCYIGKVVVITHLGRKGGDPRAYVKSAALVTDGPYGYSRHPTYVVAMAQFVLWSILALYLQSLVPWSPILLAAAFLVPLFFYLVNDLVVMPSEEAMLRRLHPQEFDAYAARVNRWFGRKSVSP